MIGARGQVRGALMRCSATEPSRRPAGSSAHKGAVSWYGFVKAIFRVAERRGLRLKVKHVDPVKSADYQTVAKRPLNSRLDTTKLETALGSGLPAWRRGQEGCMEEWMASHK